MPNNQEEIDLLKRCQEGSEEAFRLLVDRYQRRTYWIAYNMVGNYELSQDVSQEAFVRVYKAIKRFDLKRNFYTWLYQIVVNLCIDHLRKGVRSKTVDLDAIGGATDTAVIDPNEAIGKAEVKGKVHQTLNRLPPKYKAVLTLRDIQGFSCEETAEIMGCTNATVRWRVHRARKLFKALWEGKLSVVEEEEPLEGEP